MSESDPPDITKLGEAFQALLRDDSGIEVNIERVVREEQCDGTDVSITCHHLVLNGNQLPRRRDLATFLASKVVDYCIPRSLWHAALSEAIERNTDAPLAKLHHKAVELFSDLPKSGEGGEMLLYILTQKVIGAPQILCKMPLKTSSPMHYHGVDGVHGKLNPSTGVLELYWGESKLYQDLGLAITNCLKSIEPYLLVAAGNAEADRDLELLHDNLDFGEGQEDLETAILTYLDKDDPHNNKVEIRGTCLIGFNCDLYPTAPRQKDNATLKQDVQSTFSEWKKKFIEKHKDFPNIQGFALEVFLIPFDSVQSFREEFFGALGIGNIEGEEE